MRARYTDPDTGAVVETERDATGDGSVWLLKVECPPAGRGMGGASRCVQRACRDADLGGIRLRLFVLPVPDTPVRRRVLREWYRGFGFAHLGGDHMERVPHAPE